MRRWRQDASLDTRGPVGRATIERAQSTGSRPLLGAAFVTLTVLLFAVSDVLTKILTENNPVPVIAAIRYLTGLAILLAILGPRMGARLWQAERRGLVVLRALSMTAASLFIGLAFSLLPVGETVAIMYLAPFVVLALAIPIFGEKVTPMGWFLAVLGFSGVLMILRPGGGLNPAGVAFALINAGCQASFHLLTRALARRESNLSMLFHLMLVGSVVFSAMALPSLVRTLPTRADFALMVLLGLVLTVAHFLFAAAYREAPAALVAPLNYLHLVWSALLGWLVFAYLPDGFTLLGMGLIIAAGASLAYRAQAAKPPPAP